MMEQAVKRRYEDVGQYSAEDVVRALKRNDPDELLEVAISVSMYFADFEFAQKLCIDLASHEHFNVRGNAVLGFGHLARRFRRLDKEIVKPIVEAALRSDNEFVRGQAWAAADDISHFLHWELAGFTE